MNGYVLVLAMAAFAAVTGCTHATDVQRAIAVHNVFRSVILDIDAAYAPVLREADEAAQLQAAGDSAAYLEAIKPYTDGVKALSTAKQTEQAMHLSISQWEATGNDTGILRETYACAAEAVDRVTMALGGLPKASPLYAAAFAIGTQLRSMADGADCEVGK